MLRLQKGGRICGTAVEIAYLAVIRYLDNQASLVTANQATGYARTRLAMLDT